MEHDNLRQALRWFVAQGETGLALRLAAALFPLWHDHVHLAEGAPGCWPGCWPSPRRGAAAARAQALDHAGILARAQGDYPAARSLLPLGDGHLGGVWRPGGRRRGPAAAGWAADQEGNSGAARGHYEAGLAVYRALGDLQGVAWCLTYLGNLARAGADHGTARPIWRRPWTPG